MLCTTGRLSEVSILKKGLRLCLMMRSRRKRIPILIIVGVRLNPASDCLIWMDHLLSECDAPPHLSEDSWTGSERWPGR
jgi:hypothetical protein